MLYDLSKPLYRERFLHRAKKFAQDGEKAQGLIVELTEKRQRTLSQNNYLHLLFSYFAMETGNTPDYVKEQYFKRVCNRDLFCEVKNDPLCGRVETMRSSRDLTTAEMSTAIDRFRNWSSETAGIYLPEAEEREFLQEIEVEASRVKEYMW